MLILTRRAGESLRIGDEVTLTVLNTKGALVCLGFAAPKEIAVHREEVYERIHGISVDIAQARRGKFPVSAI